MEFARFVKVSSQSGYWGGMRSMGSDYTGENLKAQENWKNNTIDIWKNNNWPKLLDKLIIWE
jgi:hypothetical protein